MIKAKEKKQNLFGFRRIAYAEKKKDGFMHVVYADEPDLTYVMTQKDFQKAFETEGV